MAEQEGTAPPGTPKRSWADELGAFKQAIADIESSGGDYDAIGPLTRYGTPRGKYQMLDSNWPSWAKQAGIPGADWRNPANQERVASHMFRHYYEKYGGRWDAVAVAWFAGPGRAAKWVKEGPDSVSSMRDNLGTDVGTYVGRAIGGMSRMLGYHPEAIPTTPTASGSQQSEPEMTRVERAMQALMSFFDEGMPALMAGAGANVTTVKPGQQSAEEAPPEPEKSKPEAKERDSRVLEGF